MKCYHCFADLSGEGKCPVCGYDCQADSQEYYAIKPGVELHNGRYVLGVCVGTGGFGITYAAWDNILQTKVAIKEYLPGEFATRLPGHIKVTVYGGEKAEQFQDGLKKFYEESVRLAKFREEKGIVQIFDSFFENDTGYIVMEYLQGETLAEYLEKVGRIPADKAVDIVLPILEALEKVHEKGILHRDIAPNNIFLCSDGQVKLLDFGAARSATGTHSKSLTVLYKEGYTAEEQYRSNGNQGPWTDVYALAATLYKMITGEKPDGAMERRRKDLIKEPANYKGVKVSSNVNRAIMNALNIDIAKRTQSAEKFAQELYLAKKVESRFVRTQEKKEGRIPKWILGLSGGILTVVVALTVLLLIGVIEFRVETFMNLFVEEDKARIMNLVNMEEAEGRERIEALGLKFEVVELKYSNKVEADRIISQQEEKGSILEKGSTVHVVVSRGAGIVEVPEMEGKNWDSVKPILEDLCLEYEVTEENSIEAPGYIVSSNPVSGTEMEQGQTVTVVVSGGMDYDNTATYIVENYSGKDYKEIKQQLANAGIYLVVNEFSYDEVVPSDCISQQDIVENSEINGGSIITVAVSKGPAPRIVPDMIGMSEDMATQKLEEEGLIPVVKRVVNMDVEDGVVMEQSIVSDEEVVRNTEIELTVASHGIEIPQLNGLTEDAAKAACDEIDLTYQIQYVRGTAGVVANQSITAGEIVGLEESVVISVGMSEGDYNSQLLSKINTKRMENGLGTLSLNGALCEAARLLAEDGKQSSDYSAGTYEYTWALGQAGYSYSWVFWATRNGATTIEATNAKLPYTERALLKAPMKDIGIAYRGDRIYMLVAY